MIPHNQTDKIKKFSLVPSLFSCGFGQPSQVRHPITVVCPAGHDVSYSPQQLVAEGTLTVDEKKDDGYLTSLFQPQPLCIAIEK